MASALAVTSQMTYSSGEQAYLRFCSQYALQPVPAAAESLAFFATDLAQSRSYATVRTYLAGVRSLHVRLGASLDGFESPQLALLLRGIKRSLGSQARPSRLPITLGILQSLVSALPQVCDTRFDCLLFQAMFCVAFFGFFRIGEITASGPHKPLCWTMWWWKKSSWSLDSIAVKRTSTITVVM